MRSAVLFLIAVYPVAARAADPPGIEHFEKHVRPVLVEKCLSCHAGEKPKGGLRLDTREALLARRARRSGGRAGKSRRKAGWSRRSATPTKTSRCRRPGSCRTARSRRWTKWVELGAPWPEKVTLAAPDAIVEGGRERTGRSSRSNGRPVAERRVSRTRSTRSSSRGSVTTELSLSPRADKRTLIRRATFDLHGLPPTPEEVEAFLKDDSPDAYEKLIDRLLASPALRRALGPALARRRPLRRQQGLRLLRGEGVPVGVDVPRLRHPRVQRRHAVRPLRARATRRRSALPGRPAGAGRARASSPSAGTS